MVKINNADMIDAFNQVTEIYCSAVKNVGLWKSEKFLIKKYFTNKNADILDMGCGAGRTTFGIKEMGYDSIVGVDFSPQMIEKAKKLNRYQINFLIGNCLEIEYQNEKFDYALFSFNGLMQIPTNRARLKSLVELNRTLKKGGILIFTTHDREHSSDEFQRFWEIEKEKWINGNQDERVHDFGDLITKSDIEGIDLFIHIPSMKEIMGLLKSSNFQLVETFLRSERFEETLQTKNFSADCRFWVVKK